MLDILLDILLGILLDMLIFTLFKFQDLNQPIKEWLILKFILSGCKNQSSFKWLTQRADQLESRIFKLGLNLTNQYNDRS